MKLNQVASVAGIIAVTMSLLGYIVRIETHFTRYDNSFDLSERVNNLEKMLYPVLVELEVKKRMEEETEPVPPMLTNGLHENENVIEEAENIVEQRIQEASPTFRKESLLKEW